MLAVSIVYLSACDSDLNVSSALASKQVVVENFDRLSVDYGERVVVKGKNLSSGLVVDIEGIKVSFTADSKTQGFFEIPAECPKGLVNVTFSKSDIQIAALSLYIGTVLEDIPVVTVPSSKVCSDIVFRDKKGDLVQGERDCGTLELCSEEKAVDCVVSPEYRAVKIEGLAEKVMKGEQVAGIEGSADGPSAPCSPDQAAPCLVDGTNYLALESEALQAADLRSGVTVAGIVGTFSPDPGLPDCSADGATDCVAVADFPAVDKVTNLAAAKLAKIHSSVTVGGVGGTMADCSSDGGTSCMAVTGYPAANTTAAAAKILTGQTLAGVAGSAALRPSDCAADGGTNCVAVADFPAVDKLTKLSVANAAKIRSSLTIAGVAGTLAECASDGAAGCVVVGPTYAAAVTAGAAAKILNGQSVAGISGSAALRPTDCAADGGTDCVAVADFPAVDKVTNLAAAKLAKIHSSVTVGGVAGTMADCSSDGGTSCMAVTGYPAANTTGAAAKILTGQTLAGVSGSAALRPSDCAADGGTDCVAVADFPAVDKLAKLSVANAAKIRSSLTIAGVAGTLDDCASDGAAGCVVVGPTYAAAVTAGAAAKILSGESVAGISGSAAGRPSDCAADGGTDCVATASFPAADSTGAAAKISFGDVLAGITGTADVRPSDCIADGATGCVAVANFPAVDKVTNLAVAKLAKIHSSVTIGGVAGTMADCSSDGGTACMAVTGYPAANTTGAAAKILTGQTLAGVAGSAALRPSDCAADGGTDCVAVADFPAVDKLTKLSVANAAKIRSSLTIAGVAGTLDDCASDGEAGCVVVGPTYAAAVTAGAAAKILNGQSVAGIAGSAAVRPSDCAADGGTDCVAVADFPAVDKVTNLAVAKLAKIHSSVTVGGVAGTMADCSSDGGTACMAVTGYPAANTTGAAAKILTGQTLAGVAGSAALRPTDCAADGGTDCVAIANFPAVDKVTNLAAAKLAKIHSSVTVGGVAGTMADCSSDGGTSCMAITGYPAANTTGAAAKILTGQTLAGVLGSAAGRPSDCAADGGTDCVAIANFPAVDKVTNLAAAKLAKIHSSVTVGGVAGTMADCSSDGGTSCMAVTGYPAANTTGAAAKIVTGQTLAGVAGSAAVRPSNCSADGGTDCVAVANFPAVDKVTNLAVAKLAKIHSSVTVGGVAGTMADCSSDGGTSCMAVTGYPAANTTGAAAKILTGQTLAGVAGSASIRPADCDADGETSCVAVTNFPAVDKVTNLAAAKLAKIHTTVTVGGVAGTMASCNSDGGTDCMAVAAYPAALASGAAAKILTGQTLAGIAGSAAIRPSDCNSDNGTNCVAIANYPSVIKANVTAGVIKSGTVIAGVTGQYPNATYPLAGADETADLDSATFNAKIKASTAFEWFNSAGTRYTGSGDTDITDTKVKSGVDIFGTTGTFAAPCTGDGQTACLTTSTYKSVDTSALTAWDIRTGKNAGGIAGSLSFFTNTATLTIFNRTSGDGNSSSTTVADIYDTIDDYNNNTAPGTLPQNVPSDGALAGGSWVRDPASDTDSDGQCDGSETCVYIDKITNLHWAEADGTTRTWETAISYCHNLSLGTYTDWRLPTQKELWQGVISGIWKLQATLPIPAGYYWAASTASTDGTQGWRVGLDKGNTNHVAKTGAYYAICVR